MFRITVEQSKLGGHWPVVYGEVHRQPVRYGNLESSYARAKKQAIDLWKRITHPNVILDFDD